MELTLKRLLEHAEFKRSRGKGYDPTEVDEFMDRAAIMAGKVEQQLTQALEAAKGSAAGGGPDPEAIEAEVERRVAERVAEAGARPSEQEDSGQVVSILQMAQRTADETVKAAKGDAQRMVADATAQAQATVAEASAQAQTTLAEATAQAESTRAQVAVEVEREHREARERLAAEILELEGVREALRSDVSVLERHVEEQRSQLGSTLAELQRLLDDPAGFRMAPPPALSDPALPDFSDVAPSDEGEAASGRDVEPEVDTIDSELEAADWGAGDADVAEEGEQVEAPDGSGVPPVLTFGEVDHERPGFDEPSDGGPPTEPVAAVDAAEEVGHEGTEADPFIDELRKAMTDEEPLGPRDPEDAPPTDTLFGDDERRTWRFGRRR